MSTDETYNGWTNRETWAVALWLDNDQGMQESVVEDIGSLSDDEGESLSVKPAWTGSQIEQAGQVVREYVEDLFDWSNYGDEHGGMVVVPRGLLSMLKDIGSLYRVDWSEVGTHFLQTASES